MSTTDHRTPETRWNPGVLERITAEPLTRRSPVLFTGATVMTTDPVIGVLHEADVLLGGPVVVGVGPGIITAAGDDGAIVVACAGMTIVPTVIDLAAGSRPTREEQVGGLRPGKTADLAVIPDRYAATLQEAQDTLSNHPERVSALVLAGEIVRWDGTPVRDAGDPEQQAEDLDGHPLLGPWTDTTGFLVQTLTADGRYDETRGGRPHAFQGRFWLHADRVDYLDDLGFWAFGTVIGQELHHAGYVMTLPGGTTARQ